MLLITNNKKVLETKDFNNFKSLRFKLDLLEWYQYVLEHKFILKIIVAEEE